MTASTIRKLTVPVGAAFALAALSGCAGTKVFEGQTALAVMGTPPAAPAPPPPEPAPEPKPEEPPPRVEVRDNKIEIREKIQFEYNKSKIKEESHGLLNEIADVIKKNPHIQKIQVEGHASSDGNDNYNMRLSSARAKAVRTYLVGKGIKAEKLVAKGFGETKPIADNATDEGKEKNRRVEFNILEQDVTKKKVEIDAKGKEKVVEEKKAGGPGSLAKPKRSK